MKSKYYLIGFGLFFILYSCELEDALAGINVEDVINVEIENGQESILADGLSRVRIMAELGPESSGNRLITFTTEEGRFAEAPNDSPKEYTVTSSGKVAYATLISDTDVHESVQIGAKVSDFQNFTKIEFSKALPELFQVEINPPEIKADRIDFATVSIKLFRNDANSQVSNGVKVFFEATPLDTATAKIDPFIFVNQGTGTTTIRSDNGLPGKIDLKLTVEGLDTCQIRRLILN